MTTDRPHATSPTRVVIVGLDSVAQPFAFQRAVANYPDAELVGCCDLGVPGEVVARDLTVTSEEFAARGDIPLTHSLEELERLDFDAAFLCTRNSLMPAVATELIDRGTHVFVAKPMGVTAEGVSAYLRATARNVVLTAGVLARVWEPLPTMLKLVREGKIGRLLSLDFMHHHFRYSKFWAGTQMADPGEGDLLNWFGWYAADVVVAAMGPVARVFGVARPTMSAALGLPDQGAGIFELADGRHASARIYFSIGEEWGLPMNEAEFVGAEGVLRYRGGDAIEMLNDDGVVEVAAPPSGDNVQPAVAAFLDAVRGRGRPLVPVEEAVHIADVCVAWRESARSGTPIDVGVTTLAGDSA